MAKKLKIEVGSLVAFNMLDDATWFEVLEIDGFHMRIREAGTNYATQNMDTSLVKRVRKA